MLARLLVSSVALLISSPAPPPSQEQEGPEQADLRRVVADYVGLYRRETLEAWKELFLPTFTAGSTRPDGSVSLRGLDEFFAAQKQYLATGRANREELENVRIERRGRLASVWADFVLTDEGEKSRGKLVLLLIEERGRFRVHSLLFSYDAD